MISGAGVDTTTISDLVKRVYSDKEVENLQNMEAVTLSKFAKSSKKPAGAGFYGAVLVQGNQRGMGAQNELEALRTPASQVPDQFTVLPKVFTNTIRLSGLSMEIANGNEESFADNFTFQMENGAKDSAKERNAQVFRDGSGKLAQVNGGISGATSLVFDNGIPTHFRVGTYIDVINSGVKEIDSIQITDVDVSTNTLTLASAQTCTNDMWIYREDTADNAPTDGKELAGLPRITDDGTDFASYEGIVRNGGGYVSLWKGLEIAAGGANLSDDLLQRAKARMLVLRGTKPKRIVSNTSQQRKYLTLTLPQVQFDPKNNRDSGMVQPMTWNGIPWDIDTDCGFDEIYMYDPEYVERFIVKDLHWDKKDGKALKWDNGYDAFIAYMKAYDNIGTCNPGGVMRITGLATPTF